MGLPWPPTWQGGAPCAVCEDVSFSGSTPIFVYAFTQDLIECPGLPPGVPDPNGVVLMTQQPGSPCWWSATIADGLYLYNYDYWLTGFSSNMVILDASGMPIFKDSLFNICQDHFTNQWDCADPELPAFHQGTVDCFW